jgi:membrane associated rhomboid family serine protease
MIPLRDLVPTRTRPAASLALVVAQAAVAAVPGYRGWWVVWIINAWTCWLTGPALEDRLGQPRFLLCAGLPAAAAALVVALVEPDRWPMVVPGAVAASLVAAHLLYFPGSRVLSVMPVPVGFEFVDVPVWAISVAWVMAHIAVAPSLAFSGSPLPFAGSWVVAAALGAALAFILRRPERMTVEWWDTRG